MTAKGMSMTVAEMDEWIETLRLLPIPLRA